MTHPDHHEIHIDALTALAQARAATEPMRGHDEDSNYAADRLEYAEGHVRKSHAAIDDYKKQADHLDQATDLIERAQQSGGMRGTSAADLDRTKISLMRHVDELTRPAGF